VRLPAPLVGGLLAFVLLADVAAVAVHDDATPYTAEQAVEEFRAEATASPSPAPPAAALRSAPSTSVTASPASAVTAPPTASRAASPVPAGSPPAERLQPGVYTYATSGHEEVDILGGSRHDYPAETTMTYRVLPCGMQTRWQPLQERFSIDDVCDTSAGNELRRAAQRHTFFGQSDDEDLACALLLMPTEPRKGQVSTGTCRSKDTTVALRRELLGVTRMDVGGRSVEAVHLIVSGRLSGTARGVTKRESWLTRDGLLLRTRSVVDSDRDTPAGNAHYFEEYELNLRSLDPVS
jgi:hypothetical protein